MAELVQVTDVQERGIGRFLEQYKDKPNVNFLVGMFLDSIQELENETWNVIVKRFLSNAEGVQLDVLGDIVGQPRLDMNDATFRIWISVRIRLNRSFGRAQDVIDCIKLATDAVFEFREYDSAAFLIQFETAPDLPNDVQAICHLAKAAGINVTVIYPSAAGPGFRFKNDVDADDPDKGFADGS